MNKFPVVKITTYGIYCLIRYKNCFFTEIIMSTENMENKTAEDSENILEAHGIRADMALGEIMQTKPEVIPILMEAGMHCISCPAAMMETLEEASIVHGIPVDELMKFIKESLEREGNE